MPYLKLDTNLPIAADKATLLLKELSLAVSAATGKPESSVQVAVEGDVRMMMAGTEDPAAHMEVKGINLAEPTAAALSASVCRVVGDILGIPGRRIYIAFESFKGSMWGMDGRTF